MGLVAAVECVLCVSPEANELDAVALRGGLAAVALEKGQPNAVALFPERKEMYLKYPDVRACGSASLK